MAEEQGFAQARARLEEIVVQVRKKDTSLEQSLDLLEEGVRLANQCTELVDHAEWKPAEGADAGADEGAEASAEAGPEIAVGDGSASAGEDAGSADEAGAPDASDADEDGAAGEGAAAGDATDTGDAPEDDEYADIFADDE